MIPALSREQIRTISQAGFYLFFLSAPFFNIFRFDITEGHFIIMGYDWMFGLQSSEFECLDDSHLVRNILLNFILPVLVLIFAIVITAWKYGRIYCGWLCPHFSVVETINQLMSRHLHRVTFWQKPVHKSSKYSWLLLFIICLIIALIWSIALLGYIYPPEQIFTNIWHHELPFAASLFLFIITFILTIDFFFARHLFCKYGCSFGILQSVVWMANNKAMVIGFDKSRAHECQSCDSKCEQSCPMRLPVRSIKRAKFSCTQCGVCLTACDEQQQNNSQGRLIHWLNDSAAMEVDRPAAAFSVKRLKKSK